MSSDTTPADRCTNCAFGARPCRQCRDRARLVKVEGERDALAAEVAALKARLERAEGLLREARKSLFNCGLDFGYCDDDDPAGKKGRLKGREIEGRIDAFLAPAPASGDAKRGGVGA